MSEPVTRRTFLAASAGAVAVLTVSSGPEAARADSRPAPAGPVYGRTGTRGIPPGTASAPSRGRVVLLDGRVVEPTHVTAHGIAAGRGVLVSPDGAGGWSILYAEF